MSQSTLPASPIRPVDPPPRRSRRSWLVGAALVLAAVAVVGYTQRERFLGKRNERQAAQGEEPKAGGEAPWVKVAQPKRFPSFVVSVEELANVEAFFRVDLHARTAGPLKAVHFDKGETVRKGDLLVEIDVPDLRQDVILKANVLRQREAELSLSRAKVAIAQAAVSVARQHAQQKHAETAAALAVRDYRQRVYGRYASLAQSEAVTAGVVDEQLRDLKSAQAAAEAAVSAEGKAAADIAEAEASSEAAAVEVKVKEAAVETARGELDLARMRSEFARIRAPFDGVIVERHFDPGAFVQNAGSGRTEPLMTLARADLVTVTSRVPDRYAHLIRNGTPATVRIGGRMLQAAVTRSAPAIDARDRTLLVELDLYNKPPASYAAAIGEALAPSLGLAAPWTPLQRTVGLAAIEDWRNDSRKGEELLPPLPKEEAAGVPWRPLIPGQTGVVELLIDRQDALLVPSSAVFSRGGKRYVFLRQGDRVRLASADVRLDDGKLVRTLVRTDGENFRELTPKDEVVLSGQGQLSDGQQVRASRTAW